MSEVESALLESRALRDSVMERTEVLDRVKGLSLLPGGMHVSIAMVAAYFEIGVEAVKSLVKDHRPELRENGYTVLRGEELRSFKDLGCVDPRSSTLAVFSRRGVLNVAMLLRDSEVARQVRTYLLDTEQASRPEPVDNSGGRGVESRDERIERISEQSAIRVLGRAVVPMLNALIETAGEQRRDLIELKEQMQQVQRRLTQHDIALHKHQQALHQRSLAGVMAAIDAMNWREFEEYVAELCRRDGCTDVRVVGGKDRGADIIGLTPSGDRLVVQCKHFAPFRSVWSGEMQRFLGAAKVQHGAGVALFVATCPFSPEARALAEEFGVTAVDRPLLQAWAAGAKLPRLQ